MGDGNAFLLLKAADIDNISDAKKMVLFETVEVDFEGNVLYSITSADSSVRVRKIRIVVVAEVVEVGSGLSVNRLGIREISGLAHRHAMDKLIVTDISRISRVAGAILRFTGKLKKQHVVLDTLYGDSLLDYRGLVRRYGGKHL